MGVQIPFPLQKSCQLPEDPQLQLKVWEKYRLDTERSALRALSVSQCRKKFTRYVEQHRVWFAALSDSPSFTYWKCSKPERRRHCQRPQLANAVKIGPMAKMHSVTCWTCCEDLWRAWWLLAIEVPDTCWSSWYLRFERVQQRDGESCTARTWIDDRINGMAWQFVVPQCWIMALLCNYSPKCANTV